MSRVQEYSSQVAEAQAQLARVRRQHLGLVALSISVVAAGALLALLGAAYHWPQSRALWLGVGVAALGLLVVALWRLRGFGTHHLAQRLDRYFPELEDSTGLLLSKPNGFLPKLQQERIAERLLHLPLPDALRVPWAPRAGVAVALTTLGVALWLWPAAQAQPTAPRLQLQFPTTTAQAAPAPAASRLLATTVQVLPPAYTRQPAFAPEALSFRCPEGSTIRWTLRTDKPVKASELLIAGQRPLAFRAVANQPNRYVAEYRVSKSTIYRVRFAGQDSEDYAIEVVPDRAPTLKMVSPKPYTLVEYGRRPEVAVRVALQDDYGLARARLVVTTAQGSGEAVKFTEHIRDLSAALGSKPRQHTGNVTLRLPALGLTYGDELYVYAEAWDNAGHRARTDAALVQWEDTSATSGPAAISLGVNQMPAYFRSQRQIIIDTEKLIALRRKLPAAELQSRANNLGDDQKMLRLRYGKFLGEESEKGITETSTRPPIAEEGEEAEEEQHSADDGHDHLPIASEGAPSTEALTQPYMHLHEDEETADFLEPQVKTKLRAVLNQMWEAELRLRLAKLNEAIPFEYRALRLLKEVQQQTRVYVRKSGVDLPPLPEAEKRLSGDVGAVQVPMRQAQRTPPATQPAVRAALAQIAAYRAGQRPSTADLGHLQPASALLGQAALNQPGASLAALRAWRQVLQAVRTAQQPRAADLAAVDRALTNLLPAPTAPPVRPAAGSMSRRYFQELSR
ncbi:hypothetical protein [Solirubrum puertoriconensis]|uniref:DUF4175 domain-containing protein n=1 Tax=Solirubrum puertoriconensis TaxID=1751427 RepID=A0A9X0HHQ5_SOLP1|nr:hypothetical protein [Solirubrum puertoriconensis]KUG06120.1 hypothetical protein ASU33_01770 [Solirubrum puertoriconensis]